MVVRIFSGKLSASVHGKVKALILTIAAMFGRVAAWTSLRFASVGPCCGR